MITWIQTVLQKHHKTVFSVLLVVIIIAFVFTIGSVPFFGDKYHAGESRKKDFFGFDFTNEAAVSHLQTCVYFEIVLGGGQPQSEEQFAQLMMRQAYVRHVADGLGITQISQNDLDGYIRSAPLFAGKDGKFDASLFTKFVESRVASGRITEDALSQIFSQNALVDKVVRLMGGPGYMPKFQIEREYNQAFGKWDFNLAILSLDTFKFDKKATEAELQKYYKDNAESYKVGEGAVLETLLIPASDFKSTPTEKELAEFFAANSRKYETQKDGKSYLPKLSEVLEAVKADFAKQDSVRKAAHAAEELVLKIYKAEAKKGSAELKKILAEAKAALKKTPQIRYTDEKLPDGVPQNVAAEGLKLDEVRYYSDPIASGDGVWVVFLSEKLPAYLPSFEQIKDRVRKDFEANAKETAFNAAAAELQKKLSEKGANFAEAARANGAAVESVKDFSLANLQAAPVAVLNAYAVVTSELPKLAVGAVSKQEISGGKAYVINLLKFTPPAAGKADAEKLAAVTKRMESMYEAVSAMSVISSKIQSAQKAEK